jgi:2-haloacid dehalogenase
VYRTAIELLGVRPEQVLMAAAHNYDLAAAQALGMRTAFIPRPLEYGPGQTTDLTPTGKWDVVVDSVEELAAALGT